MSGRKVAGYCSRPCYCPLYVPATVDIYRADNLICAFIAKVDSFPLGLRKQVGQYLAVTRVAHGSAIYLGSLYYCDVEIPVCKWQYQYSCRFMMIGIVKRISMILLYGIHTQYSVFNRNCYVRHIHRLLSADLVVSARPIGYFNVSCNHNFVVGVMSEPGYRGLIARI